VYGISEEKNTLRKARTRAVRNVFLVYLFVSVLTDRYEIFAAICASFPFIFPVLFCGAEMKAYERIARSVLYGIPGVLASVLFMLVTGSYSTAAFLVPSAYGFIMCAGFAFLQSRLSEHKRVVMKCIISVSVCFLAFV